MKDIRELEKYFDILKSRHQEDFVMNKLRKRKSEINKWLRGLQQSPLWDPDPLGRLIEAIFTLAGEMAYFRAILQILQETEIEPEKAKLLLQKIEKFWGDWYDKEYDPIIQIITQRSSKQTSKEHVT